MKAQYGATVTGVSPLPCLYKDLKGSSWYDRLIAAEFDIRLDHYPERETLIDRELPPRLQRGEAWESYRKILLSLKLPPGGEGEAKDGLSPWDYIRIFRQHRARLYPELEASRSILPEDEGYEKRIQSWADFISVSGLNEELILEDEEELKRLWDRAARRILIPSRRRLSSVENMLLQGGGLTLAVSADPVWNIPRPKDLYPSGLKILEIRSPADLNANEDDFILCAHPWLLFHLPSAIAFPGEDEWFFRSFFRRCALLSDNTVHWPGSSRYGSLCKQMPPERPRRHLMTSRSFLKMKPESFIHPSEKSLSEAEESCRSYFIHREGIWESCPSPAADSSSHTDEPIIHAAWARFPESSFDIMPLVTDRPISPSELELQGRGFVSTFTYYITNNLKDLYARRTDITEEEGRILEGWNNPLLDHIRTGERTIGLPLYNKAFLGRDNNGKMHAFHSELYEVCGEWDGGGITLSETQINPEGNPATALYLPSMGNRKVAEGRDCLLVFQDTAMACCRGPVGIPPFGTVLCAPEMPPEGSAIRWRIKLKSDPVQGNWKWLFGGFNLLLEQGKNLFEDSSSGIEMLGREGWSSPLSRQTQETQLVPDIRQPRSALGRSRKGDILLLTVSGRSRLSAGAGFGELTSLAMHLCGKKEDDDELEFLINLDGGASAALTAFDGKKSTILSYPAPSDANPPGLPRPVPSLLICTEKEIN